jgi:hypothetical protein
VISRRLPTLFNRRLRNGKTSPAVMTCEDEDEALEVVVKLSAGCERGEVSLAMEMVSALLAGDLGIPLPEPYFLEMHPEVLDGIPDREWAALAGRSNPLAFGSKLLPVAFNAWTSGTVPVGRMTADAANVLLFDIAIDNVDRRGTNPNCLVRGEDLRVFDHELAFPPHIFGARPPWEIGSLQYLAPRGTHIFQDALYRRSVDWAPIAAVWKALADPQLDDYGICLPVEWAAAAPQVASAIDKIKRVRDNIDACVVEVQRLLT